MCFNALRRFVITQTASGADPRRTLLRQWIDGIDAVSGCALEPASTDASFRRYFRLHKGVKSFIAMDAPPPQEDCLPFVRIADYLASMKLSAPRVIEADLENGFLLLSDLGNKQYLDTLIDDASTADLLYADAIDALLVMQRDGEAYQSALPPYDETLLRFELSLFRDWLCATHLQMDLDEDAETNWQSCCDALLKNAINQPQVFVHRDYHSRNLMVMSDGNPGILDFQDAVEGPFTYDLVSLLKDCYICWPAERVRQWALSYYSKLSLATRERVDEKQFCRYFELMGVQRHLKAAGIFCRLNHRDGKSAYLNAVPRALEYIVELDGRYEELDFLIPLIRDKILPAWGSTQ